MRSIAVDHLTMTGADTVVTITRVSGHETGGHAPPHGDEDRGAEDTVLEHAGVEIWTGESR